MEKYNSKIIEDALEKELKELKNIAAEIPPENREDRITVRRKGNTYQYSAYSVSDNTHRTLSKDKKLKQIQRFCQAEYNEKINKLLCTRIRSLEKTLLQLRKTDLNQALYSMHAGKQQMILNAFVNDKQYALAWINESYDQKEPPENGHSTERGENVRSKSEVLIANKLFTNKIPYRYEAGFKAKEGTLHPDFTVLNPHTRKEYIWEHLGMVDDVGYAANAFSRLMIYERNGFSVGDNLIVTFETKPHPLDSRQIQKIIDRFLK